MRRIIAFLLMAAMLLSFSACARKKTKYTDYSFDFFDTATTIVGYEQSKEDFDRTCAQIKALLGEYHQLYDIYKRYEGVENLCTINDLKDGKHQEVQVDRKIIDLLLYAKELYTLTEGRMNVAMGSVLSIWHDYRTAGLDEPKKAALPPMEKLRQAAEHTDIEKIIIDEEQSTVYLADPAMSLDVGAIAKGYATEQAARFLEERGISGYILNVGGNVRCVGSRPDGELWSIGIENPDPEQKDRPYIAYLKLSDQSLVTSGSYQRYYMVEGVPYHHIINPDTLMPGVNFRSVSVLCKDSGKADALSTALFNMSYERGAVLVKELENVEAMWVLPDGEQRFSESFEKYTYEAK